MAIKSFIFALFSIAIISYFMPMDSAKKKDTNEDTPLLTFNDSTMYTLTPASMNRIIYSKKVSRYKTKDVMHEGALTLKKTKKDGSELTDIIYADIIIKKGDTFEFFSNVKYQRDDSITLNTEELIYNSKDEIATNSLPFNGNYFNNKVEGENIYLDLNKYYMKANNIHFEIETKKN